MSWFAVGLAEIRTRLILREKADCKQFKLAQSPRVTQVGGMTLLPGITFFHINGA